MGRLSLFQSKPYDRRGTFERDPRGHREWRAGFALLNTSTAGALPSATSAWKAAAPAQCLFSLRCWARSIHGGAFPLVPWSPLGTTPSSACPHRSEEHTSELQSLRHLVCRLLL